MTAPASTRSFAAVLIGLLVLTTAASCVTPATQVLVAIDTDIPATRNTTIQVVVASESRDAGPGEVHTFVRGTSVARPVTLPGTFAVTPAPGGSRSESVALVITAHADPARPGDLPLDLRRVARFHFTPSVTTVLRIFLAAECGAAATGCGDVSPCTRSVRCEQTGLTCGDRAECIPTSVTPMPTDGDVIITPSDVAPATDASDVAGDSGCDCTARPHAAATCTTAGACSYTCENGFADCNRMDNDGCEVAISTATNCGACGAGCSDPTPLCGPVAGGTFACSNGCTAGTMRCGTACVDVASDEANCGACGNVCGTGRNCESGTCRCASGTVDCGGTCIHVATDSSNCGACGNACGGGRVCSTGTCVCASGLTDCGGACVNLTTDSSNCGACGTVCTGGLLCSAGTCGLCGLTQCGSVCTDTQRDNANCGGCGNACPINSSCTGGACVCTGSLQLCPGVSGATCVDFTTDPSHCGSCTNACPATATCVGGSCVCPGSMTRCGSVCADTLFDRANCGGCGNSCGVYSCFNGFCCTPPLVMCAYCTDTNVDNNNCGGCGQICPYTCSGGACTM